VNGIGVPAADLSSADASAAADPAAAGNTQPPQFNGHVDARFLAHCELSPGQIQAVQQHTRSSGQSFTEAAVSLGFLTAEQVEKAIALTLTELSQEQPSIIEAALRKASPGRELVVRQGPPVTPGSALAPMLDPASIRGEQIRVLRTQLLILSETSRNAMAIAVVSPRGGDGRSQLAAELALSFAQLGKQTLLVDADMRRPRLHDLFNCRSEFGLADAIADGTTPYTHPVNGLPNMQLVGAGNTMQTNPLELLSDNRFARIVHTWQNKYAFVVIDTPAIAEYSDALTVATLTGRTLIISRTEHNTYNDLRAMMRRLAITQSRVLGAVLNRF
jgi:protein-tyrosine kinase